MCLAFTFPLNLNRFRPRILIDVSRIDVTTTVLGFKISMPIMIAPTAMQKMAHPDGISPDDLFYVCFYRTFFSCSCILYYISRHETGA